MRLALIAATAAVALSGPVHGASLTQTYSSLFVFGDSLSDTGNVFAATPNEAISIKLPPSPPYFNGRFSNGPVWADLLIGEFTAAFRPAASFAFGFANANVNGPAPDFAEQRGLFAATVPPAALGDRPLAAVWFGANDLFGAVDAGADAATASAVGGAAALATVAGIADLADGGIDDFLLFNLPDLSATPGYALLQTQGAVAAKAGSAAFNAALDAQLPSLRGQGLTVTLVDIAGLFADLQADPGAFGLTDATNPCLRGGVLQVGLGLVTPCASADGLAFWDSVHPTTVVHARIDAEVRAALAPVPLPAAGWLLAAALGALALRARRAA